MHNPIRKLLMVVLKYGSKAGINIKEAMSIDDSLTFLSQIIEEKVRKDSYQNSKIYSSIVTRHQPLTEFLYEKLILDFKSQKEAGR